MQEQSLAIAEIIYKFKKQGNLTEDEKTVLYDWLDESAERRAWFEAIQDDGYIKEQLQEFLSEEEKAMLWNRYQERYGVTAFVPIKTRRPWKFMVAAASVVIIGAVVAYAYFNQTFRRTTNDISATERTAQDIDPGTDKAILETSDGRKIILDGVADGKLQQEEAVTIIKTKGLLSYQESDKSEKATPVYNTIRTPRGGQYQVVLPDGSKVWLNAGSSLTFPVAFSGGTRRVQLKGEGYFEVAHMENMPFIVSMDRGAEVKVLGTHFNISAYDNEEAIKTTLLQGKVQVSSGNKDEILSPGQQAAITNKEGEPIDVRIADVEQAVAWKNNLFSFDHESIYNIMGAVQRWYDVDVDLQKATTQRFNAIIPRNITIKKLFRLLEEASEGQVHFRLEGKKVVVY